MVENAILKGKRHDRTGFLVPVVKRETGLTATFQIFFLKKEVLIMDEMTLRLVVSVRQ